MADRHCGDPQRIVVDIDVVVGYCVEGLVERLRTIVVDELLRTGIDITRLRVELRGHVSTW